LLFVAAFHALDDPVLRLSKDVRAAYLLASNARIAGGDARLNQRAQE